MFRSWTWGQIVLTLGPVLLSVLLVALYATGERPVGWPALVFVVVFINRAGDSVFALWSGRAMKRGRARLCNDLVGSSATTGESFAGAGRSYRRTVMLAGERWRAASDRRGRAGEPLKVTGRRGLVLDVVPDTI